MMFIRNISTIYKLLSYQRIVPVRKFHLAAINQQLNESIDNNVPVPEDEDTHFRTLELVRKKFEPKPRENSCEKYFQHPREKRMPVDQDWGNVWPTTRSFHPSSVPLPVRMGRPYKKNPNPSKHGNAELMKIPNFLHLTPPVVERQCLAIKKFCTKWPENLETEEKMEYHFPITVTKSTYLHSSPSIRDIRSRIVSLKVSVDNLGLDDHGLDKLLRLVNERFDPNTRYLTITADRCPISSQNEEYCYYLLSVLYNESMKMEPWEHEKQLEDSSSYVWEESASELAVKTLEKSARTTFNEEDVKKYSDAVVYIHNEKESQESVDAYKKSVLKLLNL